MSKFLKGQQNLRRKPAWKRKKSENIFNLHVSFAGCNRYYTHTQKKKKKIIIITKKKKKAEKEEQKMVVKCLQLVVVALLMLE